MTYINSKIHTDNNLNSQTDSSILKLIHNQFNYNKLIRIVSYICRCIHNCRNPRTKPYPKETFPEETILWIRENRFQEEQTDVTFTFYTSNDLLTCDWGDCLNNSFYTYNVKHPILLNSKRHLSHIIFQKEHRIISRWSTITPVSHSVEAPE